MSNKAKKSEVHESLAPPPAARQRTAEEEKALGLDRSKQPHHDYHNPHSPKVSEYHQALVVGEAKPKAPAKVKKAKVKKAPKKTPPAPPAKTDTAPEA